MNKKVTTINICLLIIQVIITCYVINNSDYIPIHWNIHGDIDAYSNSYYVLILPILTLLTWLLLYYLYSHPQLCNIPKNVKNINHTYLIIKKMFISLSVWSSVLLTYICFCIILKANITIGIVILLIILLYIIIFYSKKMYLK